MKKTIAVCVAALIIAACGKENKPAEVVKEVIKQVSTVELKKDTMDNIKDYNGELKPLNQVTVISPTGGYVKNISFKNGEKVKAGDVILKLTDAATESKYYEAEGTLIKSKSDYNTAKISFDKHEVLYKKNMISEDAYLTVKNKLDQTMGNLKIAEAGYISAKDNFDRLTVTAKIPGVITDMNLKEHEKINAAQTLLTVVDSQVMEMHVAVAGSDIKNIPLGTEADIYVEELGKNITGKITEINLAANSNTKKFDVKILMENKDMDLLKGMYGKVNMKQGRVEGIFVPKEAIMIKDLYAYIAVVREEKSLIYKVEQGESFGSLQEVYFKDFQEGDKLVIKGQYLLKNNDKVKES